MMSCIGPWEYENVRYHMVSHGYLQPYVMYVRLGIRKRTVLSGL